MTRRQLIDGYLQADKPYDVYAHTKMGGYMEFMRLERGIMFEENARNVADTYAATWPKGGNVIGVCVRMGDCIVYEAKI